MDYTGTIIEESLTDPYVLRGVKIVDTIVELVTPEHKMKWAKVLTIRIVEIPPYRVEAFAEKISESMNPKYPWQADFRNNLVHFIIFPRKVFRVNRFSRIQYDEAKKYGRKIGVPEIGLDYPSDLKEWES